MGAPKDDDLSFVDPDKMTDAELLAKLARNRQEQEKWDEEHPDPQR